jgi:sigma-B regulation protein RsbU (phosphoserine phosphatase)
MVFVNVGATDYVTFSRLLGSDPGWIPIPEGGRILVEEVRRNGPASALLRNRDKIVALNGQQVNSGSQVLKTFQQAKPASIYTIIIRRDDRLQELTLQTVPYSFSRWLEDIMMGLIIVPGFLLTGFAVFFLRPHDKQALLLALTFGTFTGIVGPGWMILSSGFPGWLIAIIVMARIVSSFFPAVFLHFFLVFPEPSPLLRRFPRLEYYLYLPYALTAFPHQVVDSLPRSVVPKLFLDYEALPLLDRVGKIVLLTYGFCALVSLVINYRQANPLSRRKMRVVLAGTLAGFLPVLLIVAADRIFRLPEWIWSFGFFTLILVPPSFAYAIVRHQVIPVSLIIRRSARYLLVWRGFIITEAILLLALLSFLLTGSRIAAIQQYGARTYVVGVLISIGAAVLLLRLLNLRVMPSIDRRFFREAYDTQQILSDLGQAVRTVTNVKQLLELVATKIQAALHTEDVTIFLRDEATGDYVSAISSTHIEEDVALDEAASKSSIPLVLPHNGLAVESLRESLQPLTTDFHDEHSWVRALVSTDTSENDSRQRESETLRRIQCVLLLPVATKDQMLGIISLSPRLGDIPFSGVDKQMLMTVAWQTAYAMENAQLVERKVEEEQLRRELEMAAAVQRRLFPERPPKVENLELAGVCYPARGVGGDYYDFLPLGDGQVGIAVADVAGKGMSAALLMSTVQAALRSQARSAKGHLTEMVSSLNELLYGSTDPHSYATFFYAQFDEKTRLLTYVNAGHNPPLLVRSAAASKAQRTAQVGEPGPQRFAMTTVDGVMVATAGAVSADDSVCLLTTGGSVIGLFDHCAYEQETIQTKSGDVLVAYTDGVTEALNPEGEEFGEERLRSLVAAGAHLSADGLSEKIVESVRNWCRDVPQHDDLTLVVVKIR